MGKVDDQQPPVVLHQQQPSRTSSCRRCSVAVYRLINFKCTVVLTLSIAAFLSAFCWVLPLRYRHAGFDAKDFIKFSATVQAYFRVQRPVTELVPCIARLEYDLTGELGVPSSKVAILSIHQEDKSNWSNVVFGFLPDPINSTINPVSLSLLKSSLIDLFLEQYNLTLKSSLFGDTFLFEILKFPGGITVIPERAALILQIHEALFNFTLNSTIYQIKENLLELKEQLKLGLHLMPNEAVYIQVTNKHGSTKDSPVTIEASVVSDPGTLSPERLRRLAQIITGSAENLGLDHSVFGKVKEISLSTFLNHSLHAPSPSPSPSPSPAPSPKQIHGTSPSLEPSCSPAFSPHHSIPPCPNCYASAPSVTSKPFAPSPQSLPFSSISPIVDSPECSVAHGGSHYGSTDPLIHSPTSHPDHLPPSISPTASSESPLGASASAPQMSPDLSPLPGIACSGGLEERSKKDLVSPPYVLSSYSSSRSPGTLRIQWLDLIGLLTFLLIILIS